MAEMNRLERELEEASRKYNEGDFQSAYDKYLKLAEEGNGDCQAFVVGC